MRDLVNHIVQKKYQLQQDSTYSYYTQGSKLRKNCRDQNGNYTQEMSLMLKPNLLQQNSALQ